jgi:hypothetical protein
MSTVNKKVEPKEVAKVKKDVPKRVSEAKSVVAESSEVKKVKVLERKSVNKALKMENVVGSSKPKGSPSKVKSDQAIRPPVKAKAKAQVENTKAGTGKLMIRSSSKAHRHHIVVKIAPQVDSVAVPSKTSQTVRKRLALKNVAVGKPPSRRPVSRIKARLAAAFPQIPPMAVHSRAAFDPLSLRLPGFVPLGMKQQPAPSDAVQKKKIQPLQPRQKPQL